MLRVQPGFFGEISELLHADPKYALAVGVFLEPILDYWVVDSAETACKVGQFLKQNLLNKSVLVLNDCPKLKEKDLVQARVEVGPFGVLLADVLSIKNAPQALSEFVNYRVNGVAIFDNVRNASERVRQGIKITGALTLDGNLLKKRSIEGAGSRQQFSLKLRTWLQANEGRQNAEQGEADKEVEATVARLQQQLNQAIERQNEATKSAQRARELEVVLKTRKAELNEQIIQNTEV